MSLKIALLIESSTPTKYVFDLVRWAVADPHVQIEGLVVIEGDPRSAVFGDAHSLVQRVVFALERRRLSKSLAHRDHLTTKDLSTLKVPIARVSSVATGVSAARAIGADLLVAFGPGGADNADMAKASRLGVVWIGPSEERRRPDGPPGFRAVLDQSDSTGFTIRHIAAEGRSEVVLMSGRLRTEVSLLLNQANLLLKSLHYLKQVILRIATHDAIQEPRPSIPDAGPARAALSTTDLARYLGVALGRAFRFRVESMAGIKKDWHVAFVRSHWRSAVLSEGIVIPNSPNHFLADPFFIRRDGKDYVFVEELDHGTNRGSIAVYELIGRTATRIGVALSESFHLSFPFLFEFDGRLMMLPETYQSGQVRLYECVQFPLTWRLVSVPLREVSAADSMMFEHRGRWWMLTNLDPFGVGDHTVELNVYYADSPLAMEWTPHPANPVIVDASRARNGGLLRDGDRIYRVSQAQGFGTYGKSTALQEIVQLSESAYAESTVCVVEAGFHADAIATHHLHGSGDVTVFDVFLRTRAEPDAAPQGSAAEHSYPQAPSGEGRQGQGMPGM